MVAIPVRQFEERRGSRVFSIENAVAQQRLEGLTVSPDALADMQKVADGEMTTSQAVGRVMKRVQGELRDVALLGS
jgi:hypothetical protein